MRRSAWHPHDLVCNPTPHPAAQASRSGRVVAFCLAEEFDRAEVQKQLRREYPGSPYE